MFRFPEYYVARWSLHCMMKFMLLFYQEEEEHTTLQLGRIMSWKTIVHGGGNGQQHHNQSHILVHFSIHA